METHTHGIVREDNKSKEDKIGYCITVEFVIESFFLLNNKKHLVMSVSLMNQFKIEVIQVVLFY